MNGTSRVPSKNVIFFVLVLAALTFALFAPAVRYDYVKLDDDQYICQNLHVTTGLTLENIQWAFTSVYENWWSPLLWMSYMLDTTLFGPNPFGYHLTNIILHTASAVLLFWVLFRMTGARWRSFFVAAFFALHPLRVESVVWITERKDVLSGFFFMAGLLAYLRYVEHQTQGRFWTLPVLMLLGLMSKSNLIILPFVLLLLDYWPLARAGDPWGPDAWKKWRPLLAEKLMLFYLSLIFIFITLKTHIQAVEDVSGITRFALIPPNYWFYIGKLVWPVNLSIFYPVNDHVYWPLTWAALAGLVMITLLFVRIRKTYPSLIVGWLWFLVMISPLIRGIRLDPLLASANRYAYLPSIGFGIMLVWGFATLMDRYTFLKRPILLMGAISLLACMGLARAQLPLWKDSMTMFSHLIKMVPDNYTANNNYGKALLEQGQTEAALAYFARATKIKPLDTLAPANYADALISLGRDNEAIEWLHDIMAERDATDFNLNVLLGFAYLNTDRAGLAIPHLQEAITRQPDRLGWQIELVRAYFEAGQPQAAQEEIQRLQAKGLVSIRDFESLIPHYVDLWRHGEQRHAWLFFKNTLKRQPDNIKLLNQVAWLLATDPLSPAPSGEAQRLAQRAVQLTPTPNPVLLDTLAAAYAANGQFEEAVHWGAQAQALAQQAGRPDLVARATKHLAAFQQRQPWRE